MTKAMEAFSFIWGHQYGGYDVKCERSLSFRTGTRTSIRYSNRDELVPELFDVLALSTCLLTVDVSFTQGNLSLSTLVCRVKAALK